MILDCNNWSFSKKTLSEEDNHTNKHAPSKSILNVFTDSSGNKGTNNCTCMVNKLVLHALLTCACLHHPKHLLVGLKENMSWTKSWHPTRHCLKTQTQIFSNQQKMFHILLLMHWSIIKFLPLDSKYTPFSQHQRNVPRYQDITCMVSPIHQLKQQLSSSSI